MIAQTPPAGTNTKSSGRKLKGVAIGAGYFSQFHFDAWSRLENVEFAAICDMEPLKSQSAAAEYSVPRSYSDFGEMLEVEKPDFVDIITRPDSHLPLTQQAVEAGVAVICQKPLAPSYAEAQQLVDVAAKAKVPLMVHENFRFQPWYREIKRLLDAKHVGDQLHSISIRTRTGDGWQSDAYLGAATLLPRDGTFFDLRDGRSLRRYDAISRRRDIGRLRHLAAIKC